MKKNKKFYIIISVLFCFMAATLAGAYFAAHAVPTKKETKRNLTRDNSRGELLTAKDKTTIMIMGIDPRELEQDIGRSDTLMIATVDPFSDKASLLSIPRDTRVLIPRYGYDKINAAYAYGGEQLTKRTVEDFLGIGIDYYVLIDTRAFVKIIDAIGGIDIDVEKRMQYEDPWDDDGGLYIDLYPGQQHMDGKTAITYVRYRDEDGDIGRIERQQKFMKACMDKLSSPLIITKIPALATEVMSAIKTDLSTTDLIALAGTMYKAQKNGLTTDMVPGEPMYIDEISYWIPNLSAMRMTIADTLGIMPNSKIRSKWEETEREYKSSIPRTATPPPAYDKSIGREVKPKDTKLKDIEKKEKEENNSIKQSENTNINKNNANENGSNNSSNLNPKTSNNTPKTKTETKTKTPPKSEEIPTRNRTNLDSNVPTQGMTSKSN